MSSRWNSGRRLCRPTDAAARGRRFRPVGGP
jgi:hypothetical protein